MNGCLKDCWRCSIGLHYEPLAAAADDDDNRSLEAGADNAAVVVVADGDEDDVDGGEVDSGAEFVSGFLKCGSSHLCRPISVKYPRLRKPEFGLPGCSLFGGLVSLS